MVESPFPPTKASSWPFQIDASTVESVVGAKISSRMDATDFLPGDPIADSAERAALRATVRRLVADVSPPERTYALDEAEQFDDVLHAALAELGLLAVGAPASAGGVGDVRDQLVVVEELAAGPTSMAAFLIAQYAVTQVLAAYGSTVEHQAILADLLRGRTKLSFALSEPAGGTDVARVMRTRAEAQPDRRLAPRRARRCGRRVQRSPATSWCWPARRPGSARPCTG